MSVGSYFFCVVNLFVNVEGFVEVGWKLKDSGEGLKSFCFMGMSWGRKLRIYKIDG